MKILCTIFGHWFRATTNAEYRWSGDNYVCRFCGKRCKGLNYD